MVPHYNMVFFLFVRARSFSHFTLSNPLVGGSVGGFLMRLVGSVLGINNKTSHPHTKRKHSERERERTTEQQRNSTPTLRLLRKGDNANALIRLERGVGVG